jgi:hypothetical protein
MKSKTVGMTLYYIRITRALMTPRKRSIVRYAGITAVSHGG